MTFSNPAAFWLLSLLALLLLRQRRPPVSRLAVATLHLWQRTAPKDPSLSRQRRRIDMLMLLQGACIIALVVALAEPTVATQAVVIVVDTSLSMGASQDGTARLHAAVGRMVQVLDALPPWTTVRVFDAGRPADAETERELSAREAKAHLAALTTTATQDDIPAAIERATHAGPSRIYVVTDRPAPTDAGASGSRIEWFTVGQPADNVAITGLSLRRRDSGRVELLTEMRNYGTRAVRSDLSIRRDAAHLAGTTVRIEPGRTATALHTISDEPGVVIAKLTMPDALALDNERRLVMDPARRLRVELRGGGRFLALALAANPAVLLVDGPPRDVVVCHGCQNVPTDDAGVVLVPPPPEPRGGLAPLMRLHSGFGTAISLDGLAVAPTSQGRPPANATVIATAGGAPAITTYSRGAQRVVELGFDPDTSPLSLTPAFPLLVAAAVSWAYEPWQPHTTVDAGQPVGWMVGADVGPARVSADSGAAGDASIRDGWLALADTSHAGTFTVTDRQSSRVIAINPWTAGESDLQTSAPIRVTSAPPTWTASAGSPSSSVPLLFAAGLLAAEWRLRQRTGRRG